MARLQVIFPLLLWALWRTTAGDTPVRPLDNVWPGTLIYLGGLTLIVLFVHWRARSAMRRTTFDRPAPVPRFHRAVGLARWGILIWQSTALWDLGFGDFVLDVVPTGGGRFDSLLPFVSVLPVVAAWVGLIVAQYPVDRAVREQNALFDVEFGQTVRPVPMRAAYTLHAVRSHILFTLLPLLAIALLRDGIHAGGLAIGWQASTAGWVSTVAAVGGVIVLGPEIVRRVLPTQSLPESPGRDRLEALARSMRLGVRDILLWRTHHAIGNAAVMGIVPGVRYVLITDLLLESMPPEEIEAVFAHEAGHVKHRHIVWYLVYWLSVTAVFDRVAQVAVDGIVAHEWAGAATAEIGVTVAGLGIIFAIFGALSRAFERQADLFAARRLTAGDDTTPGRDGAAIFASALRHVARVNNLPLDHRSLTAGRPLVGRIAGRFAHQLATWLHGSIRSRIDHLARLAGHPPAARRFDRAMLGVRGVLLMGLIAAAWAFKTYGGSF